VKAFSVVIILALLAGVFGECTGGPRVDPEGADAVLTPPAVRAAPSAARGHVVLWGGAVISVTPQQRATRIEVLGYPLDSSQRPQARAVPQGRFWVVQPGYLEPLDFIPGRLITVRGEISGVVQGRVGTTNYLYPVVVPSRIYRWPVADTRPRVHFGIGVMFGN